MKPLPILFICALMCLASSTAKSQLFVGFKASEGVPTAKTSAEKTIDASQLVGVVTLGDTNSAVKIPIPGVTFLNYTDGTSQGWIYFYRGKVKGKTTDTIINVPVAKSTFSGFAVIPIDLGLDSVGGFFAKDSVIPSVFTDSDIMIKNINTNAAFKSFIAAYPNSKPFLVPLGFNPNATLFPKNTLVWEMNFPAGGGGMICEVHGVTGETKCQMATGVEEITQTSSLTITPNPATLTATISIPNELFSPFASIELFTSIGTSIQRYSVSTNIGEKIVIPLDGLNDGVYFVKYTSGGHSITTSLVVQN